MTQPERELWTALRAKRFAGVKVARQVVIGPYIADFVVRSHGLVIEVDGDTHAAPSKDEHRTAYLVAHGYRVIRFGNADVMTNTEGVLTILANALAASPLPTLSPEGRGLEGSSSV
jgi:very-short-patch-repair endonuclease